MCPFFFLAKFDLKIFSRTIQLKPSEEKKKKGKQVENISFILSVTTLLLRCTSRCIDLLLRNRERRRNPNKGEGREGEREQNQELFLIPKFKGGKEKQNKTIPPPFFLFFCLKILLLFLLYLSIPFFFSLCCLKPRSN